jgi:hypothetical protein
VGGPKGLRAISWVVLRDVENTQKIGTILIRANVMRMPYLNSCPDQ